MVEKILTIFVDLHAVHSQFQLLPAHGIHFGYIVCGHLSESLVLKICNRGVFAFDFFLSNPKAVSAPGSPRPGKSDIVSQASKKSAKTVASAKTATSVKTMKSHKSSGKGDKA
jgi:hydrocephalus-inducing protein